MKQVKRSKCVILWFHLFSGIGVFYSIAVVAQHCCSGTALLYFYSIAVVCFPFMLPVHHSAWENDLLKSTSVPWSHWTVLVCFFFSFYFMLVFRWEFNHMQKELLREQTRCKILEEELQKPLQVHRWRKLEVMCEHFVFPKPLLPNQWPSKSLFHLLLRKCGGTGQTEISIVPMESLPAECFPCTMQSVLFLCHFLIEKLQGDL